MVEIELSYLKGGITPWSFRLSSLQVGFSS
jgi:hypothetical protein